MLIIRPQLMQKRKATLLQNTPIKVKGRGQTPKEVKGPEIQSLRRLFLFEKIELNLYGRTLQHHRCNFARELRLVLLENNSNGRTNQHHRCNFEQELRPVLLENSSTSRTNQHHRCNFAREVRPVRLERSSNGRIYQSHRNKITQELHLV